MQIAPPTLSFSPLPHAIACRSCRWVRILVRPDQDFCLLPSAFCLLPSALLFSESPADPKHVTIRVPQMHLAHVPRHVGRRERDVQPSGHALLVDRVHVLHPHRHPSAFVCAFVSTGAEGRGIRGSPSASSVSL